MRGDDIISKKIKLPVTWEVCGMIEVEAESIEDAIKFFANNSDRISLPYDSDYVDGSLDLSCHEPEFIEIYN